MQYNLILVCMIIGSRLSTVCFDTQALYLREKMVMNEG